MLTDMILILMGPTGCGKSTIGQLLARRLGWPFIDGDDYHPEANVAKMHSGIPLTDDDRLTSLAGALIAQGYGLPGGPPLPDNLNLLTGQPGVVLRAAEIDVIE